MELIERTGFLSLLQIHYENIAAGEGHCVFVTGEAGIGKSALVKTFCKEHKGDCNIYQGACDALFAPRPLAPLYDILWQVNSDLWPDSHSVGDRSALFAGFFRELSMKKINTIIVFEDIHWADEATLDFIKFLARRITQLRCLFILTYRDNEIQSQQPLRNVLGQLPTDSFSRIQLTPLSQEAVEKMAFEKGYSGEDVYSISGGNPFYVNEILASYSIGVPDNIKDSILSTYNRTEETTKHVWDLMSVSPASLEIKYLEKLEPSYAGAIESCLEAKIIIINDEHIFFKHELFRRTVESSLSPLKRISLNQKILDLFKEGFEQSGEIERIIHHAKNANEYNLVFHYSPIAAAKASCIGAHMEASKLYLTTIEYYQGNDKDQLIQLYKLYAYECYLTNQLKAAIIYTGKLLSLLKEKNDIENIGDSMRFLSRLWWLDGNRKNAGNLAEQAIELLSIRPSSAAKAMAFSNMSQLKMLYDQYTECISWGEKAIAIATEVDDKETLSHALNNVGSVKMNMRSMKEEGKKLLHQSLDIALKNSLHEHAARAYSNLSSNGVKMKDYVFAKKILAEGIQYCEERDLDSWRSNMLSLKAHLNLETGNWKDAFIVADNLRKNENQSSAFAVGALTIAATIKMRRGDSDALMLLLDANAKAFEAMELQRIVPALIALLEYEWLTGISIIRKEDLDFAIRTIDHSIYNIDKNEFSFWLLKARQQHLPVTEIFEGYDLGAISKAQKAAALWKELGCPYARALALFEGSEHDKRKAIEIVLELGANAVYEKMKLHMRSSGIKSIPRGISKATRSNPAFLTGRELDVLHSLKDGLQNKEIASRLFISAKTVDHHISAILFKLEVNTRIKAVKEAMRLEIIK